MRAHQNQVGGLKAAIPHLIKLLESSNRVMRQAAIRALIVLDARDTADELMELALGDDLVAANVIEPVLARWDFRPMRTAWLQRLDGSRRSGRRLLLAVRAAASVGLTQSADALLSLTLDAAAGPAVRMESAQALAVLVPDGLQSHARSLMSRGPSRGRLNRLLAATLLTEHRGPDAIPLLLELAGDEEPAVAAIALRQLLKVNPEAVEPLNEELVASPDPQVQTLMAGILGEQRTAQAVGHVGEMLYDEHPDVRQAARDALIDLDRVEQLRANVRAAATRVLATDRLRSIEEAVMIVGTVDHEPAAPRLVQLLRFEDAKVRVAAAWALRRLQVMETAEPILKQAISETEKSTVPFLEDNGVDSDTIDSTYAQLEQLIEALGLLRHREAAPLLLSYLPNPPQVPPPTRWDAVWREELRVRAVWALGLAFELNPTEMISSRFEQRLQTDGSDVVRGMAAVGLGRMNAQGSLNLLRSYYSAGDTGTPLTFGCAWSVTRMTGEAMPEFRMKPSTAKQPAYFLEPILESVSAPNERADEVDQ